MGKSLVIIGIPSQGQDHQQVPGQPVRGEVEHRPHPVTCHQWFVEFQGAGGQGPQRPRGARRCHRRRRPGANWSRAWGRLEHGWKASTRSCPAREKVIGELRPPGQRTPTPSISRPTWTAKGRPSPGTCGKPSAAAKAATTRVVFSEITRRPSGALLPARRARYQPGERPSRRGVSSTHRVVGAMISPLLWQKLPVGCPPTACSRWR